MQSRLFAACIACLAVIVLCPSTAPAQEEIKPMNERVVGGVPTDIKHHPWQVGMLVKRGPDAFLCGGSIIADRWVLTAAHCFTPTTSARDVRAKAGATDLVASGSWVDIERVVIHEDYNATTHENDIALVRLRTRPQGKVVPLVTSDQALQLGTPLEVTGWGATSEGGRVSSQLLKASVPYAPTDTCNAPAAYNGAIRQGMMCAGRPDGGVDSCQGDSGGPLVWRSPDGAVLVGVVSWGEGCARKLRYGVYTRVADYRRWIESVIVGKPH
jgi:trypsin